MNIAQALCNQCGSKKATFSRQLLLDFQRKSDLKIQRSIRKRLFQLKIWNFDRKKSKENFIKLRSPMQQTMPPSILCSNLRSSKKKLDELAILVTEYNCYLNVFTESWLSEEISDTSIQIQGFNIIRRDRIGTNNKGGILIYIKKDISYILPNIKNNNNLEILPIFLPVSKILVIAIYHPYWGDNIQHDNTIDFLFSIIKEIQSEFTRFNNDIIILGDFNDLRFKLNSLCSTFKLCNIVDFPTRGDATLDCCFTNLYKHFKTECLAPVGKSDHNMFKCMPKRLKKQKDNFKLIPDYSPSNREKFNAMLNNVDFSFADNILNTADFDYQFDYFIQILDSLITHCFPIRKIRCKRNSLPWVNDTIRICISKRNAAHKSGNIHLFKHYRKKVTQMLRIAKMNYAKKVKHLDSKSEWKTIKRLANLDKNKENPSVRISPESFLDYFSSIQPDDDYEFDDFENLAKANVFITSNDIYEAVKKLKKGGGCPFIQPWMIKNNLDCISKTLSIFFNASFSLGYVPKAMKRAIIKPIAKIKNPKKVEDFRPISSTSPFLKILERIFTVKYLNPLISESIFSDQFAFIPLKGRGCTSALTCIYGTIINQVDLGHYVNLVLVDFSKAFDRASLSRIVNSLISLNASYQCILWVCSFIHNREVSVNFSNSFSPFKKITGGTPQGSIVSPILFAILLSSLKPLDNQTFYFKYADDLTIVQSTENPPDNKRLAVELNHVVDWCTKNKMIINESKTHIMHISNRKTPTPPLVVLNDEPLTCVESAKLLGIFIQTNLKWDLQIVTSIMKASRIFFPLLQLRRANVSSSILWHLYQSLVRSTLTYAYPAMCNMSKQNLKKLMKTEKRFINLLHLQPNSDLCDFFNKICLRLATSVQTFNNHPFRSLLQQFNYSSTRSRRTLIMPHCNSTLKRNSFIKYFL